MELRQKLKRELLITVNGCVVVLFIDTGKCLDVEVLSKVCYGFQKQSRQRKNGSPLQHARKCKANCIC